MLNKVEIDIGLIVISVLFWLFATARAEVDLAPQDGVPKPNYAYLSMVWKFNAWRLSAEIITY